MKYNLILEIGFLERDGRSSPTFFLENIIED